MNSPLVRYLRDFGAEAAPAEVQPEVPLGLPMSLDVSLFDEPAAPVIDLEAERGQAYDEGYRTATEKLTAQNAEEIAALQEKHAEEMKALRQQFEGGAADYLAGALPALADRVTSELTDATANLLAPILKKQVERVAVEELAAQLRPSLSKEILEQVRVSGPAHLCDLLEAQLEEKGHSIVFTHTEGADLRVEIGDSLLVTRLSVFAADLEKVFA